MRFRLDKQVLKRLDSDTINMTWFLHLCIGYNYAIEYYFFLRFMSIRVQGTWRQGGDSCPDLESCQGGDCGQNFRSRGGIVLVWQKFQVRTPKNKAVFSVFSALRAQNFFQGVNFVLTWTFSEGGVLSWPGLFQGGEYHHFLDLRGGIVLTCHWPLNMYEYLVDKPSNFEIERYVFCENGYVWQWNHCAFSSFFVECSLFSVLL